MSVAASWRSAADWERDGLLLTTGSNQACKLYDAALTQYITWTDEPSVGGLEKTLKDCIAEDPKFVMGRAISVGLDLIGTGRSIKLDPTFRKEMDELLNLASTEPVTDREKRHVKALKLYSEGFHEQATQVWEDILTEHPTDLLALKLAHDTYFFLGQSNNIRDSIASVLPLWKPSTPLYSYLHGMHAFGLEETNLYPEAEHAAKKGLEMNCKDGWATHALAHVYEMQGRTKEGITFMSTTLRDWRESNFLAKHNFWHWALYHIEQGEPEAAVDIFENQLATCIRSGSLLDIVDCTSLLWRLKMEGVDVSKLCGDTFEACRPHFDDHLLLFNDIHFLMACLVAGDKKATDHLTKSFEDFLSSGQGSNWRTSKEFGAQLFMGLKSMSEGKYSDAVAALLPIRYDIYKMGGSHAQRDLFNIALISSAVKSDDPQDRAVARKLLLARQMLKGNCSLAQRLGCHFQTYLEV